MGITGTINNKTDDIILPEQWAKTIYEHCGENEIPVILNSILKNMGKGVYTVYHGESIDNPNIFLYYSKDRPGVISINEFMYKSPIVRRKMILLFLYIITVVDKKNQIIQMKTDEVMELLTSKIMQELWENLMIPDVWIKRNCPTGLASFYDIDAWSEQLGVTPSDLEHRLEQWAENYNG